MIAMKKARAVSQKGPEAMSAPLGDVNAMSWTVTDGVRGNRRCAPMLPGCGQDAVTAAPEARPVRTVTVGNAKPARRSC